MTVGREVEIIKPRTDKREYRRIVLSNSLQVLLISDPETDKCAASMNVGVGSFCDPVGLEGLAHFLEHMLFYASEKYPLEDSYSKYITEHGGSTNAFTASETTNYYFDVNTDCFEEASDRFAQFFIKPLMSADATTREIKAVDSENQKNLLSDAWRMSQLQKHLSLESHPYHNFSTGNWDTLDVKPKAKGVDTRQELLKFYEEKYSANLMHLVVYSKENLDKIQSLVEDKFQEIRNSDRSRFQFPGQPCTSEHLQILVRAVPIKQGHKLRIVWPITPSILHYKEGPCRYLGHLIGHEGEGSLFYVLKKLGWAAGLSAGEGEWTSEFSFFKVVIDLTDAGQDHMQDIIGLLFNYIQRLQQSGVCKWIFDESNVNALIDMKLEKHKNLREESRFYWREILEGTLKFDRREAEVAALKKLTQQELIEFFNENIKVGATRKKTLSVNVYGNQHLADFNSQKSESNTIQIDDIFRFKRYQPLYGSFKGGFGQMKL